MTESNRIPLASAISELRKEIKEAAEKAKNEDFRFILDSIDIELTVVAEDSAEAGGEVGWWVFKGNAKISEKDTITHKVKITLKSPGTEVNSGTRTD